jgi:acetyl esterase
MGQRIGDTAVSQDEPTAQLALASQLPPTAEIKIDSAPRVFLAGLRTVGWPAFHKRSVAQARRDMRTLAAATSGWRPMARVGNARVHAGRRTIPVRVYRPFGRTTPSPLLVWFHGGGFVVGDLFTADGTCRRLADASGAVVVSVDYRLAPEHPLPAAHEDAVVATRWAIDHCKALGADPARVVVGGDSAGANLATHVSRVQRDDGNHPVAMQLLVYPATDLSLGHANFDPRVAQLLTPETLHWFGNHAMPDRDAAARRRADISPMFADNLAGLPPAMLITAGVDPVRSDGTEYLRRLRDAGVSVVHADYPGQIHGFFGMDLIFPAGSRALVAAAQAINTVGRVPAKPRSNRAGAIDWQSVIREWHTRTVESARRLPTINAMPMFSTLIEHHLHAAATALRTRRQPQPSALRPLD